MDDVLAAASRSALFQGLTTVELQDVAALARRIESEPGERIFAEGDVPDAMYLVAGGSVRIVREIEPVENVLGTIGAGEAFGEMGLLLDLPRNATAVADEPTVLLRIDRASFLELLESQDRVAC